MNYANFHFLSGPPVSRKIPRRLLSGGNSLFLVSKTVFVDMNVL